MWCECMHVCGMSMCVYCTEGMDELSFKSGDLIMLKSHYGTDWFRGKLINGREGIFPKNFVEVVVSRELSQLHISLGFGVVFCVNMHRRLTDDH